MHSLYLLQSKTKCIFYIGITDNLSRRLSEHNSGNNPSTKAGRPWELLYCECFKDKRDAVLREKKLKSHGKGMQELKKRLQFSIESE